MNTYHPVGNHRLKSNHGTGDTHWQEQCKGHGDELKNVEAGRIWITEDMEEPTEAQRELKAMSMCSGCPVFTKCGEETLRMRDHGVVRYGKALVTDSNGPELCLQYDDIRRALGKPHGAPFDLRECRVCGNTMSEKNFPGTVVAHSKLLCINCYNQRVKEQGS